MMPANGFIGFITSQGFFVGLVFATLKFDDPIAILLSTLFVTGAFYMLAQVSVSYFVRYIDVKTATFANKEHEAMLDHFVVELQRREDVYEKGIIPPSDDDMVIVKKPKKGVKNAA